MIHFARVPPVHPENERLPHTSTMPNARAHSRRADAMNVTESQARRRVQREGWAARGNLLAWSSEGEPSKELPLSSDSLGHRFHDLFASFYKEGQSDFVFGNGLTLQKLETGHATGLSKEEPSGALLGLALKPDLLRGLLGREETGHIRRQIRFPFGPQERFQRRLWRSVSGKGQVSERHGRAGGKSIGDALRRGLRRGQCGTKAVVFLLQLCQLLRLAAKEPGFTSQAQQLPQLLLRKRRRRLLSGLGTRLLCGFELQAQRVDFLPELGDGAALDRHKPQQASSG
jgi:hypothetical protein